MITHEEFIKKYNLFKNFNYHQENGWLRILYLQDWGGKIIFEELPSKIEFTEKCKFNISIEKIKKIPPDVVFNNKGNVDILHAEEISENVVFNNDGSLLLGDLPFYKDYDLEKFIKLKKIHPSVKFTNNGYVFFSCIVYKIPSGIVFNNKGDLYLGELKKVHSSVKFINDRFIYFYYGTNKIPKGIIFNNRGGVNVSNVKKISENVIFNNGGHVILNRNIKVVFSKGVKFNNKGDIINVPIYVPKFLDPKKYLNKMIEQLYK